MTDINNLKQANATFDTIVKTLEQREWKFDADKNKLMIDTGVKGNDLPIPLKLCVDADRQLVILYSYLPVEIPENKRLEIALAISVINHSIVDGSFDYNAFNGNVVFRLTTSFKGSILSPELFDYMIDVSSITVDEYNDKIDDIVKGKLDLKQFIDNENKSY